MQRARIRDGIESPVACIAEECRNVDEMIVEVIDDVVELILALLLFPGFFLEIFVGVEIWLSEQRHALICVGIVTAQT